MNKLIMTIHAVTASRHPRWQEEELKKVELQLPYDRGQAQDYLELFCAFHPNYAKEFISILHRAGVNKVVFQVDAATEPF